MSLLHHDDRRDAFAFYECLARRRDGLFDVADALLCADGPVTTPVDLTLVAEHRRGNGALYAALNEGRINADRLRRTLAALPQPRAADHRLVLAADVSNWLRPDAECSPERFAFHHRALRSTVFVGEPVVFAGHVP